MKKTYLLVVLSILILGGCRGKYYISSPRGYYVESLTEPYTSECNKDTASNDAWFYAADSILVKNVDVSRINKDVSRRFFSSKDINYIRSRLKLEDVYFEIQKAASVNLGKDKIIPDLNSCFLFNESDAPRMFYIKVPFKKRSLIRCRHYAYQYPVTILSEGNIVVHDNKKCREETFDSMRQMLFLDVDSLDVERWVERCRQGKQKVSYFINEGRVMP